MKQAPVELDVLDMIYKRGHALLLQMHGPADRPPVCADLDGDCRDVPDKVHCWLYDPAKGRCPFLSAEARK